MPTKDAHEINEEIYSLCAQRHEKKMYKEQLLADKMMFKMQEKLQAEVRAVAVVSKEINTLID